MLQLLDIGKNALGPEGASAVVSAMHVNRCVLVFGFGPDTYTEIKNDVNTVLVFGFGPVGIDVVFDLAVTDMLRVSTCQDACLLHVCDESNNHGNGDNFDDDCGHHHHTDSDVDAAHSRVWPWERISSRRGTARHLRKCCLSTKP